MRTYAKVGTRPTHSKEEEEMGHMTTRLTSEKKARFLDMSCCDSQL